METRRRFILTVVLFAAFAGGLFFLFPNDSLERFVLYSIDIPPSMSAAFGFDRKGSLVAACRPTTMTVEPMTGVTDGPIDPDLVWPLPGGGVYLDQNRRLEIRNVSGSSTPSVKGLGFVGAKGLLVSSGGGRVFKIQGKRVFVCDAVSGSLIARREFSFIPVPLRSQVSPGGDIFISDSGWGTFEMMVSLTREAFWAAGLTQSPEVTVTESRHGEDAAWSRVYRVRGGGVCIDPDGRFIAYHVGPFLQAARAKVIDPTTVERAGRTTDEVMTGSSAEVFWPVKEGEGEIFIRFIADWALVRRVPAALAPGSRIAISPMGGLVLWPFHGTGSFFERFSGMGSAVLVSPDGLAIALGRTKSASWGSFVPSAVNKKGEEGKGELLLLADPARGELRALRYRELYPISMEF